MAKFKHHSYFPKAKAEQQFRYALELAEQLWTLSEKLVGESFTP